MLITITLMVTAKYAVLPLLAALGAGSALFGTLFNAGSQSAINRSQQAWNEKMYGIQRKDALADWNMQNEYNSPAAVMQRYRDAKLNPNLIYGNGTNASAGVPRSSSVESWSPKAPEIDTRGIGDSLMSMYDIQLKEAQTDNIKAATSVANQDAMLKAAQIASTNAATAKTGSDTEMVKFNLNQAQRLSDISVDMAAAQLNKVKADTSYTLDQNERAALQNAQSLQKGVEEILKIRYDQAVSMAQRRQIEQQIANARSDNELKKLDIAIKREGISWSDPMIARIVAKYIDTDKVMKSVKDSYHEVLGGVSTPLKNILQNKK